MTADRTQLYRDLFAQLALDHPVATRRLPLVLRLETPATDRLDVTVRFLGRTGKTYAQLDGNFGPGAASLSLGPLTNLANGIYTVVVTPPLEQFFSTTPIERRLPCIVDGSAVSPSLSAQDATMIEHHPIPAIPITSGGHHFFGYYDKFSWNKSGRYHLGLRVNFIDRQPTRDDVAIIGLIDTDNGNEWIPVAETTAWSWQQGTMAQWLPSEPESTIIYNIRDNDRFYAVIHNIETGEKRRLSRSFYSVGTDYAVGLNFARAHVTRPGYGYPDGAENNVADPHPADDGVYRLDLTTGASELIITLQQLYEFSPVPKTQVGPHSVEHLTMSPEGSNFVFLNRCVFDPKVRFNDRLIRSSPDGTELRIVHDNEYFSHFHYFDEDTIVAWARTPGINRAQYALYRLDRDEWTAVGDDVFTSDGHCQFSPDRKWMLTDTYPDANSDRTLMLYEMATGRRIDIGKFHSPPALANEIRCDLHPRWDRDGKRISVDSAHTGERQIYSLDISEITG